MESATSKRQSLRTAGKLPDKLTAFIEVGATLLAMMGDQTLGKRWWDMLIDLLGAQAATGKALRRNFRVV